MTEKEYKLTQKQEKFKNLVISGYGVTEAYREAYDCENMGSKSINKEAVLLSQHPKIAPAIEEAKKQATEKAVCTAEWVAERLKEEAQYTGEGATHSARIQALNVLKDYTGDFDKNRKKMEVELSEKLTPWDDVEADVDD